MSVLVNQQVDEKVKNSKGVSNQVLERQQGEYSLRKQKSV